MEGWRKNSLFWCIALLLPVVAVALYWQTSQFDFVMYDDGKYVTANNHVKAGLTAAGVGWAFSSSHDANWFPLTWLSHMATVQFFGLNAGAHHLVNVLLHATNTFLTFFVFHRLTGALWQSAFVAALFALHPLHVESVAWVAERKDVLSAFFWLTAMLAYSRYGERPGMGRYLLALFLFACGLMTKPMLVTLPFVLLLLDFWPLRRFPLTADAPVEATGMTAASLPRLLLEKVPFILLSTSSSIITFIVQRKGGAVNELDHSSLLFNAANAFVSYVRYIIKMLWPRDMAVFYPIEPALPPWQVGGAIIFLLFLSAIVLWQRKKRPYLVVGWFWYLGTLVPVIGFVRVGMHAMADRYTYIPFTGLFVMVSWGLAEATTRLPRAKLIAGVVAVAVVTGLAVSAHRQLATWRNDYALFEHALGVTKNNWLAHNNLATALMADGRLDEAFYHVGEALRSKPDYAAAYNNLGVIYNRRGDIAQTIAAYDRALSIDPTLSETRFNLGLLYLGNGEKDKALRQCQILERFDRGQANELLKFIDYAGRMQ